MSQSDEWTLVVIGFVLVIMFMMGTKWQPKAKEPQAKPPKPSKLPKAQVIPPRRNT